MRHPSNCLRYWDLSSQIRLDDAIALWCNVDPVELGGLGFDTHCMSAKRAALVTALREGRLEYEDLGIVGSRGQRIKDAPLDELLQRDRLLIHKDSLRRWFEQLPFEDRPAFLFDEMRQPVLPDGSEATELNSLKALAIMGHLLARSSNVYRTGDRPNAAQIGQAVAEAAQQLFGDDVRGFKSFHKKMSEALMVFDRELPKRRWEN